MSNEIEYTPFGEEWEKELMKLPKKFIIGLYRKSCLKNKKAEGLVEALELIYKVLKPINDTATNDIIRICKEALTKYKGE